MTERLTKAEAARLLASGKDKDIKRLWEHGMRFVNKIVSKLDKLGMVHDAEEARAVGYLAIGEAIQNWNPKISSFNTYVWARARGEIQTAENANRRRGIAARHGTVMDFLDSEESDEEEGPDTGLEAVLNDELRNLVSKLPEQERTVIEFMYFHGLSQADTSLMTGYSRQYVNTLHRSGLDKLKLLYN